MKQLATAAQFSGKFSNTVLTTTPLSIVPNQTNRVQELNKFIVVHNNHLNLKDRQCPYGPLMKFIYVLRSSTNQYDSNGGDV
jgi:hypothetical protein